VKQQSESFLFIAILGTVGLFGIWLQNLVLEDEDEIISDEQRHDPDYYIENFIATGLDKNGARRQKSLNLKKMRRLGIPMPTLGG